MKMCVTVGERHHGRLVAAPLQKAIVEDAKMFVTVETPGGDSVIVDGCGGELDPRAGRLRAGRSCGVDGLELVETGYDLALLAFLAFPSCREVGFLEEIQAIGIM